MIVLNILLIVLAILSGYVLYHLVFRGYLKSEGFLNESQCLTLKYYTYKNTLLVLTSKEENWIWYNGEKVFVYGSPVESYYCDGSSTPAYVMNVKTGHLENYECILPIQDVLKFYEESGAKEQTVKINAGKDVKRIGALDVFLYFVQNNYITINLLSPLIND